MTPPARPRSRPAPSTALSVALCAAALLGAVACSTPPATLPPAAPQPASTTVRTDDPTVVRTDAGAVRGATEGAVLVWRAIPYAQPPVGALRWRAPRPAEPWDGVRPASAFGPSCPQADVAPVSEDCLTLNVWRPSGTAPDPLPVMVWIHGGAMVRGGTSIYPMHALAARGVVVVSMNYRLGRLGFFAHPALAAEAPGEPRGNYGHLDQIEALHWVRRNVAAFGGDPSKVTVFGESAGGGSVLVHLTSPMSRGLFHRAILQSPGTPGARASVLPVAELPAAERLATDWARSVGAPGDGAEALARLRGLPVATVLDGASGPQVLASASRGLDVPGFAWAIRDGRTIVDPPQRVLAEGRQARVPTIVGANDRELWIGAAADREALFVQFGALAGAARAAYDPRGDLPLAELRQQALADRTIVEPARHFADEMARAGLPVWHYRFAHVPAARRAEWPGVPHGMEIPFTIGLPEAITGPRTTVDDRAMAALASGYWAAFARTGDPNGDGRPAWPRHDPAVDRLMVFGSDRAGAGPDPLRARLDLWRRVQQAHR